MRKLSESAYGGWLTIRDEIGLPPHVGSVAVPGPLARLLGWEMAYRCNSSRTVFRTPKIDRRRIVLCFFGADDPSLADAST